MTIKFAILTKSEIYFIAKLDKVHKQEPLAADSLSVFTKIKFGACTARQPYTQYFEYSAIKQIWHNGAYLFHFFEVKEKLDSHACKFEDAYNGGKFLRQNHKSILPKFKDTFYDRSKTLPMQQRYSWVPIFAHRTNQQS